MVWTRRRQKQPGSIFQFFLFVFVVIGIVLIVSRLFPKPTVISPLAEDQKTETGSGIILSVFSKKKNPDDLKQRIKETVGLTWKNYSVLVVDTQSDFTVGINEEEIFTAASVNKIPILAALYTKVQSGDVDLDKVITMQQEDIQDYGTGSMRYDGAGTTYTIKTLAKLMMQQSDNTAAYILANHIIGIDVIQQLLAEWNMTQTDMVNNKTSNADISFLMKKIYQGNIANVAYTKEMLAFFKDGEFEDRLPGLLPKDVTVYHKIGSEIGVLHDVGIVAGPTTKYYIGIMTSDITDEEEAVNLIAKVSKIIYDYMK
ncbi:MAG: serine hydrolase [Candidatus Gottesmanbacteria bacterium]